VTDVSEHERDHVTAETADELIDEAAKAVFQGWDFRWLGARSEDPKTPWRYPALAAEALAASARALDIDTGGGEALAALAPFPGSVVATEGYPPNIPIAGATLKAVGVPLVGVESALDNIDQAHASPADTASHLPFRDDTFDVVLNRHSSYRPSEVARVLGPGGTYLTQQRGDGDNHLLRTFGRPIKQGADFDLAFAVSQLERAGFDISRAEDSDATVRFFDVGALVYYLRAIPWIVPAFDVDGDRETLHRIHDIIQTDGSFGVGSYRFLIEARTMP
jgi:SAM-dependent methyltransferase